MREVFSPVQQTSVSAHTHPMNTRAELPEWAHVKHMQTAPHTHSAHRHRFPLQVAETPTPVSRPHSQSGLDVPPIYLP